ncbi:uncharacterized protein METZ01_LOCUS267568 [marine metagenome]|uniref:Uncharacterized protein n=1 Tax=marine metagenome TaxID=408172 RepID=A0A382JQE0_9ZZZZ
MILTTLPVSTRPLAKGGLGITTLKRTVLPEYSRLTLHLNIPSTTLPETVRNFIYIRSSIHQP